MVTSVHQLVPLVRQLADPRGRCNRQGFLNVAVALLALQVGAWVLIKLSGVEFSDSSLFILNAPLFWIGTAVCVKRLHDLGRKGWLIPAAFAGWVVSALVVSFAAALVLGPVALLPGSWTYSILFAVITIPALGALLWLHMSVGQTTANAFGPVPDAHGFSMPAAVEQGFEGAAVAA